MGMYILSNEIYDLKKFLLNLKTISFESGMIPVRNGLFTLAIMFAIKNMSIAIVSLLKRKILESQKKPVLCTII